MSNKHYLGRGEVVGFGSDKFYIKEGLFAKRVAISKILQGGLGLDIFPQTVNIKP